MKRTHTCGELDKRSVGKKVVLTGWVHTRRDHGGVVFIDIRDRYGLTQIVFNPEFNKDSHKEAEHLRREDVILISGVVKARGEGLANPNLKTGEIEVFSDRLEILNKSATPPIEIDDRVDVNEDIALKYRYLDLRKPSLQKNMIVRHKAGKIARDYFDSLGFLEIETPMLAKSTPEGARDYIVPSRVSPGKFYALPQSPQIFKQLLMVAGFDRYFQIVKCFRDEDLRADRQPEFTQIDLEMSFPEENDIYTIMEGLMKKLWKGILDIDVKIPFKRVPYDEAMERYGSDKPDLRFGLELKNITNIAAKTSFKVFADTAKNGGLIKGINVKGAAEKFSRKDIDDLIPFVQIYGAKGLAWMKYDGKQLESSIVKYFSDDDQKELIKTMGAEKGDLLVFVGDPKSSVVNAALGNLRIKLGKQLGLIDEKDFNFCWITDFPLFEYNEDEGRYQAMHHPFTSPKPEDIKYLDTDPTKVKSIAYDLTLNGVEVGGGSIRIHQRELQEKMFKALGITPEEAQLKFGFLLEAFKYGAPPHGGLAFGFDRLCALMVGTDNIRNVIAFPKTKSAESLMDEAPSVVDDKQLKELHIKLDIIKMPAKDEVYEKIVDALNKDKIEFETIEHKAVYTSEEAAEVRGISPSQGVKALICKTDKGFVQACVPGDKEIDLEKLKKVLQTKSVELASADEVKRVSGCSIGSVPPFGNLFEIKILIDKQVTQNKEVAFNAGTHTKSIKMRAKDLTKVTGARVAEFSK
ncbi:MAG: aspartate--tRNA ligase [Nanoarchaeota archaeon]|nr:aspartate--tRNA ligase [Nanoarchaeota archaeon]MBU1705029.1 aspartate--tRNA ligase [Nanoarchaeota archaeon]